MVVPSSSTRRAVRGPLPVLLVVQAVALAAAVSARTVAGSITALALVGCTTARITVRAHRARRG
ncbi:hypothetical protein VSR01_03945 [Actinacidiphila sp. DG2A-62]|uniref:hypothetical protein n=1 Tax=Actinacidiphila sp. DG2A-62 TaxID=3108821 RepID=UPI002DBCBEEA|nr:hypothetical protein [Actinacidiphila sp. DG2A-62]MEC3992746.1 hypothetical protein [Actinacidiphila sp. DG2A-62]